MAILLLYNPFVINFIIFMSNRKWREKNKKLILIINIQSLAFNILVKRIPLIIHELSNQEDDRNQKKRPQEVPSTSQLGSALGVLSADSIIRPYQKTEHRLAFKYLSLHTICS